MDKYVYFLARSFVCVYGTCVYYDTFCWLKQVIDSSDVVIQVLDARDPLGTRCYQIERYMKKEKPHKHLIFVLNKVDLIPVWVTVSQSPTSVWYK